MNILEDIFPVSKSTKCLIFTCFELALSVLLGALDVWCLITWQEKLDDAIPGATTPSYHSEEQFTHIPLKRLEMIEKIFIFMLIFHLQGVLLNVLLIYTIVKSKYKFFIMWILANSLKVFCLSALIFFLSAVFLSLGIKRYQVLAIVILFTAGMYGYIHYKFSNYIYSLYLSVKNDASSRMRCKRSQSKETIIDSTRMPSVSSGTDNVIELKDGEKITLRPESHKEV